MNESKPNSTILDAATFDRLVDGELSPAEYRRVLVALEQQPGAWRKCAEAFLQAATQAPQPIHAAASKASSAIFFGIGISLASGTPPVLTET